ncbi:hypothetical protein D9M69_678250 [compost metagenome]
MRLPFDEVLLVVEVAIVRRNAVVAAHILGLGHFLTGDERLVEFLAVAGANDFHRVVEIEQLFQGLGEISHGGRRRLLDEDVTLLCVLEGVQYQIDRILQRH